MLEQGIVHLPEAAIGGGSFGRLCRMLRVRMYLCQRKIAEHEPQLRPEAPLDFLDDWIRASAVRTLVVAVFNEGEDSFRASPS